MATAQVIDVIFRGRNDADTAIGQVERGLAKVNETGEGVGRLGDNLDGFTRRLSSVGPMLAAAFGIGTVAGFAQQFVAANVEVERFVRAVAQISGSGEAAGRDLAYLRDVSDRLGLSVRETSGAYVSLLAATKGTALEGQATRDIFESVARAMATLGRSSAETEGALLAVQQMISKGVVSSEELRGQLGERLPGAFQTAARAMGTTTQGLGDMLQAGQVLAVDFLPKFADELNKTFGSTAPIDGYTAALNRLKNQFDETLIAIGGSGLFDTITDTLKSAADTTRTTTGEIDLLTTAFRGVVNLARGGSFETFSAELGLARDRAQQASSVIGGDLNQSLAETARLSRLAGEATGFLGDQSDAETQRLTRQANAQATALKEVGDAFKTLGVNPEKIRAEVSSVMQAFETLANNDSVGGGKLLAGLEGVLKNIDDAQYLPRLKDHLQAAWEQGRITSDELARGMGLVAKEQDGLDKKLGVTTKSIEDQSKAAAQSAEKARERAETLRLELEKLASNERIKTLEFRANINIEQIKAQAAQVQAAFESIDNTVNSTADVITKAFGALAGGDLVDSSVRNTLFKQIDIENQNRTRALNLQSDLTVAQVKVLEAQAAQINKGDALIKVDGSGLKPHLEAFMWEILKAIQVRTNRDGLNLLLGVS